MAKREQVVEQQSTTETSSKRGRRKWKWTLIKRETEPGKALALFDDRDTAIGSQDTPGDYYAAMLVPVHIEAKTVTKVSVKVG